MKKFIKLSLISLGILSAIIFIPFLILMFSYDQHDDYYYKTPDEFLNSKSFSWYIDIFPKSSRNIFLRTFIETNGMIVIFETNTADDIPTSQIQPFLDNGKLYCYFYSNNSPYLVSKYYSNNPDLVHYMFTSLRSEEVLELCPLNTVKTH